MNQADTGGIGANDSLSYGSFRLGLAQVSFGLLELAAQTGGFGGRRLADLSTQLLGLALELPLLCLFCVGRKPLHLLADFTGFGNQVFLPRQIAVETRDRGIRPLRLSGGSTS